jgi:hypothetical protein
MIYQMSQESWNKSSIKDASTSKSKVSVDADVKDVKKVSTWDSKFQPLVEEIGMQDKINYKDSKHIMRAVNGRYDNVMSQLKTEDPALYNKFKQFKNNSWDFAKELEVIREGGDNAKINEYYKKATVMFIEIANSLDYTKNKKFAMDENARVLTREQYDKYSQEVQVGNNSSTNARVVRNNMQLKADYETWNTSAEYAKLKNVSDYWMNSIKKKAQPIVSSWVATSLKHLDVEDTSKADFNRESFDMNVDLLKHVSKYGTIADSGLSKKDKDLAMSIRKEMWGKDYGDILKVLKNRSEDIQGMSNRLGFHGSIKLLNNHKDTVGKKLEYYPRTTEKTRNDFADGDMLAIEKMTKHYKEFKEVDGKLRNLSLDSSKNNYESIRDGLGLDLNRSQFNIAMDALVDDNGNIMSYKKWKDSLRNIPDPSGRGFIKGGATGNIGQDVKNARPASLLGKIWEQNKTTSVSWEGGINSLPWGQTSKEDKEDDLIAIYNGLKGGYKKEFSKIKANQVYDSSLLAAGFGNVRNQSLQFKGVDLNLDKNYQLKNSSGKKQENVNKLIGLMKDDRGEFTTENITLFGNDRVNAGLNAIQKDELADQRENNAKVAKDFFKGDMSNVTVEFFRNTNVPGQAAYSFYNTKTKKSMVMYAPKNMLGKNEGVGEDMYVHTARDPQEFTFNAKGYQDMKVITVKNKPAYKSARLSFDQNKNAYIGSMWYYDKQGNIQQYQHIIPLGQAVNLKDATDNFNKFLMDYSKEL